MSVELPADFAAWLALREPADATARRADLAEAVRRRLPAGPLTIHDLGSGTGSMARWLAPQLPGPQHWVLYDQDADLLARAAAAMPQTAADGSPVTAQTRVGDLTRLTAADLADAALVTASALLDMLTAEEVDRVVAACAGHRTLFTLSVTGRVVLTPADPLDAEITAAFNDHQRRTVGGRSLLGPDAVDATVAAFARHGVRVDVEASPWRLGGDRAALVDAWFTGWLAAAGEHRPQLSGATGAYAERRRAQLAAGELRVLVDHHDLLASGE